MGFDFSDTIPAPPGGRSNVQWQTNGTGEVSANVATPAGTSVEPAHYIYAGPVSGADALPTFRLAVAGDVPAIAESGVTGLVSDLAAKAPNSRLINTTAPITGGGDLSADRTLAISVFGASGGSHSTGAVPDPGSSAGTTKFLREDATFAIPPGGLAKYTTSWSSQTSVTVTHGLGTTAVIVQVFDGSGVLVIPESATVTSSSVVTLTFGAAFTGSVVVIG